MTRHKIFDTSFADIYPLYIAKVERKDRTKDEVDQVICWLTGYDDESLAKAVSDGLTMDEFFSAAPAMNPNASLITGSVCGVKVQEVKDPLMRQIRYLDKLVDELAKGRPMAKILRGET